MPIPANLKRLRAKVDWSQARLAKESGVAQQLISQLERGINTTTKKLPDIARALGVVVSEIDENYDAPDEGVAVAVPLISWVSAGALALPDTVLDFDDVPHVYFPNLDPRGDWIALRVDGDSMNLAVRHNSIIFVNRNDKKLVPNLLYVVGDGEGGATFKRYRPPNLFEPYSTLPHFKTFVVPEGQDPDIIGRVCFSTQGH
jgi:transcriptional regulator with XRE-family HTH domain